MRITAASPPSRGAFKEVEVGEPTPDPKEGTFVLLFASEYRNTPETVSEYPRIPERGVPGDVY